MSDENEKIAIQFSEDTSGVNPSDLNLTTSGTVDKEVYHGADAIAQVEANIGRPLSYAERRVVEEEGYVATPYTDTKGITTQGVGQTGEWIEKGFEAAYQHHVDRTRSRIPEFDQFPEDVQAELIQAEYRGDLGGSPKFLRLFNQGQYRQAADEFLDNADYRRSLRNKTGVHKRMERVANTITSYAEKTGAIPEVATDEIDFEIGDSGYQFVDGDTFRDTKTGEMFRLPGIDLQETSKVLRDKGYIRGEAGGYATKLMIAKLANRYGFTIPKVTDKDGGYERKIGDLVDENGNSFTDFLLSGGIAKPSFIGETKETLTDSQFSRYLMGVVERNSQKPNKDKTDLELARELINASTLEPFDGKVVAKRLAFNEAEYAMNPDIYSGVMIRNVMADMDNRSITPFSQSWDSALIMISNAFKQVGAMGLDIMGFDQAEAYLLGQIDYSRRELAKRPKVRLDYRDVDWTKLDEVGEFVGANLMTSLPFMGVTIASILAGGATKGLSYSIPVAMYSGLILDEMEGEQEDKNYGAAVVGGSIAAALDVFGIRGAAGLIKPSHFVTKEGREDAIKAIMAADTLGARREIAKALGDKAGNIIAVGATREQATLALARMTKRQIAGFADDAAKLASNELAKGALLKRFTKGLVRGAAFEGSTEMLQELTQYTAAVIGSEKQWDFDHLQHRLTNAAIAGGILGAGFSMPGFAWDAGGWKDASVAQAEYDNRFDDLAEGFKSEERAREENEVIDPETGEVTSIMPDIDVALDREQVDAEVINAQIEGFSIEGLPESTKTKAPETDTNLLDKLRSTLQDRGFAATLSTDNIKSQIGKLSNEIEAHVKWIEDNVLEDGTIKDARDPNQQYEGSPLDVEDKSNKSKRAKLQAELDKRERGEAKQESQEWYDDLLEQIDNLEKSETQGKAQPEPAPKKFQDAADDGAATFDGVTTREKLKDAILNPMFLLQSALDTRITEEMLIKSRTLRIVYDMFNGKRNKTFDGVHFQADKNENYGSFAKKIRHMDVILQEFELESSRTGAAKRELSTLMYRFYEEYIRPITYRKNNNAKWISIDDILQEIDFNNLSDPKFRKNSAAIKKLLKELYAVDEAIYKGVTERQRYAGESIIGDLQDHVFRSKIFLKEKIIANKEQFIQALMESKKLTRDVAVELTNIITDTNEIRTLEDAFDLTKGGLLPSTHKRRSLDLSDDPLFADFLEQNLFENLEGNMRSAARYMTMLKFIGRNSKLLTSMMHKVYLELRDNAELGSEAEIAARKQTDDIARNIRDLINADSGNYKRIQSDAIRGATKFTTLAAVLTMLPLAAPMSIVELALTPIGVDAKTLNKNIGSIGKMFGQELYDYFTEMGRLMGVVPRKFINKDTTIKSRILPEREQDPRFISREDPKGGLVERAGFLSQKTGQAQLVGVTESNQFTAAIMDAFFKVIGLTAITTLTRTIRAAFFNDFLIHNLNILHEFHEGNKKDTNEVREARRKLEDYSIPVDKMLGLSSRLLKDGPLEADHPVMKEYERQFNNGLFHFINEAVPLPDAMGRPLFYSNPHLALFMQFQGFISKFTAHHLPRLFRSVKESSPGYKYSTFATMASMLVLGYSAQYLKDLIKFGGPTPYLTDNEKYLRALYTSGLLGTTERLISNNYLFPLYEERNRNLGEAIWNFGTGEAPASGLFENMYNTIEGLIKGDSRQFIKSGVSNIPLVSPAKHRVYDALVEAQWITGDN